MANTNIVIDPLTRIEGHLRIEATVENGKITSAWTTAEMYRGLENTMTGRSPQDAYYIAQRICGVCPISHGHTSTLAVESAAGIRIPDGARLVRNILEAAEFLHSHILWFYTLAALDYVNPAKALQANIADTYALAEAAGTKTSDFKSVQDKLAKLVASGDLSIFTNGWWGVDPVKNPAEADALYATDMPAELHLIGVAHYLEALEMQAEAARIIAMIGGKFPHAMTSLPGGTAWVPTADKIDDLLYRTKHVRDWVWGAMVPDTLAIAGYYKDALSYGGGVGNFLAWGVFNREDQKAEHRYLPSGMIVGANGLTVSQPDTKKVREYVEHSWYKSASGLDPQEGKTEAIDEWTDKTFDINDRYSWCKSPRYDGLPLEAGPLARMLVGYLSPDAESNKTIKGIVDYALGKLGTNDPTVLVSSLGRVAARNLEAALISDWTLEWIEELVVGVKGGDIEFFTPYKAIDGKGAGLWEAPRGALSHYVNVKDGRIENYQFVIPTTWNAGPRDNKNVPGPIEQALVGVPIANTERPIEAARLVRSFDPCTACCVHVVERANNTSGTVYSRKWGVS